MFIAATAVFLLRLVEPATLIPDSYDIAAIGECLWLNESQWLDCNEVTMGFRPIVPAILLGPFLTFTNSLNSLSILCTLSIILFLFCTQRLIQNRIISTVACILLIAMPTTRQLLGIVDARILILGPLMWAYLGASGESERRIHTLLIGLAAALVALSRPEHLLSAAIIMLWHHKVNWKNVALRCTGVLTPIVIWIAYLSHSAGQFVLTPRHWEGWILEQSEMPLRWSQQLYGMGVWSPPLRDIAISFPSPPQATVGLSAWEGIQWISHHAIDPSLIIFTMGTGMVLYGAVTNRHWTRNVLVLLAFMLPNLVSTVYPQARDPLFSQSNLIPSILGLILLGLIGFAEFHKKVKSDALKIALFIGALGYMSAHPLAKASLPQVHNSEAGHAYINAYQDSQEGTVIASFETAPLLYYTKQKWQQHPSPFEERPKAERLIYSHLDTQLILPTPLIRGKKAHIEAAYLGNNDQSWVIVYRLEDRNQ